jgi:hypothetical protein
VIDIEQTRTAINDAVYAAVLGTLGFTSDHRAELAACTPATPDALLLQAALAYLFGNGLIKAVDREEDWLSTDIPEPFAGDLVTEIRAGVEHQRRINAAIPS